MKKIFTLVAAAMMAVSVNAQTVTLDLTKATTELAFDSETGAWTGSFDQTQEVIESQSFIFIHNCNPDWHTWWGFTASNSADNSRRSDYITYQYSNMAQGGIVLDEDGSVKRDENGVLEVSAEVPYLVAYYSEYNGKNSTQMIFNDGMAHEVEGVYVNLNSYAYYNVLEGNPYGRTFNREDDKFTLTIHGVKEDETEATVDVTMASYANGDLSVNRGWKYVDLTSLGAVNELYFTMDSSDSGAYGMNTPGYFCLDKLTIKGETSGVASVNASAPRISYDRASQTVNFGENTFAVIYNASGVQVKAGEGTKMDISSLERGIYVVKASNGGVLKIAN